MNKTRRRKARARRQAKRAEQIAFLDAWREQMMAAAQPDMEQRGYAMFEMDADGMHSVPVDDGPDDDIPF